MGTPRKSKKTDPSAEKVAEVDVVMIDSIKGFDRNLSCRGFKFEIGKTYTVPGPIKACESGFHAIEGYPLEVFDYYPPGSSRFAKTQQAGELSRQGSDSKIASAKITIGVELSLGELIQSAVKWIVDRAVPEKDSPATGYQGAASATGDRGAASATGARRRRQAPRARRRRQATGARRRRQARTPLRWPVVTAAKARCLKTVCSFWSVETRKATSWRQVMRSAEETGSNRTLGTA